jgi:hypothetical protein
VFGERPFTLLFGGTIWADTDSHVQPSTESNLETTLYLYQGGIMEINVDVLSKQARALAAQCQAQVRRPRVTYVGQSAYWGKPTVMAWQLAISQPLMEHAAADTLHCSLGHCLSTAENYHPLSLKKAWTFWPSKER